MGDDAYANAVARRREIEDKLERVQRVAVSLTKEAHEIDCFLMRYRRLAKLPPLTTEQIMRRNEPGT